MESYIGFAQVYDKFMDNVDYKQWCDYVISILKEYGIEKDTVVELGCGSGNATKLLSEAGYHMIGIDNSQEMLEIAMDKRGESEILYVLQDMRTFELPGSVPAMVSIGDSMNYITEDEDLKKVFSQVARYLEKDGIFVFDLKTIHYFSDIGEAVIAEDRDECSFIWDNYFNKDDNINEYQLSVFVRGEDGRFDKYEEVHYQRAYSLEEIKNAAESSGLKLAGAYNAFTKETAGEENDRIYVVMKK